MSNITVLGANGMLGSGVFSLLKNSGFDVVGTYCSNPSGGYFKLDAMEIGGIQRFLSKVNPDVVIDAIGNPDPDWCEANKDMALDVNALTARNIAAVCPKKLVFISTDYVFDGSGNPYKEEDEPSPVNHYGMMKHLGELYVKRFSHKFLILRLPLLYDKKYILNMAERIRGETLIADRVLVKHPTWVGDVAKAIKTLIEKDACGVYHLGNKEGITRYEWALNIARFFGHPESNVVGANLPYLARRPLNVELDTDKIGSLGVDCGTIDKVLGELF